MLINQKDLLVETTEETTKICQGVRKNNGSYEMIHVDRDAWMMEIVNNFAEEGYVSIKRASATTGEPVFTELFKIDHEGVITSRGHPIHIVVESATAPTSPFEGMGWLDTSSL